MYDPRTNELVSLEPIPEAIANDIEPEFLGDRSVIEAKEGTLNNFVRGLLSKHNLQLRETYGHVIDMKRLQEDYRLNYVNERSFVCIDKSFF